jgi:hypothetical protein
MLFHNFLAMNEAGFLAGQFLHFQIFAIEVLRLSYGISEGHAQELFDPRTEILSKIASQLLPPLIAND